MTIHKYFIISFLSIITLSYCRIKDKHSETAKIDQSSKNTNKNEQLLPPHVNACGFLYHRFNESKYPSTNISTALFEEQLIYLIQNNIPVITLGQLLNLNENKETKNKYVIITIDDAFNSFYKYGFPILKKYGVKGTLFINTETVGSGDYLGWNELQDLLEYGIEIGNHTHSHDYFLNIDDSRRSDIFKSDVQKAQKLIKERLNFEPMVFAYPYGEYDLEMQKVIRDLGFRIATAQNSGVISNHSDPLALPRFPMTDNYGKLESFKEKVRMNPLPVVKVLPNRTIPFENPPTLNIQFMNQNFDLERLQCFIQGSECKIKILDKQLISIQITAIGPLKNRRHLYTITIPDKQTSEWYWFSHQWVFPDKP